MDQRKQGVRHVLRCCSLDLAEAGVLVDHSEASVSPLVILLFVTEHFGLPVEAVVQAGTSAPSSHESRCSWFPVPGWTQHTLIQIEQVVAAQCQCTIHKRSTIYATSR